ncbi:hypothetical protein G6F55_008966 [Rhizopus delemar]|uniref:Reverse transcriptase RNase H-like domain-containing protein n=2 Tax=Rhizopus TaxID=4842 RepID=A0A9P6YW14_9FUNG|nr:hypothetical protein G6F55_008966 [Rhizopus delemar]KAG1538023.1 hypothetical protein G6F51_010022 [Rhizopus arrhizus]KAG1491356.1 hypothetical protein G6F54_010077 [Rhizopus delemar]KAG1506404.1 hypothetical protein G6F53_009713 [Rhizopus delemar]KAG1521546.1 hypothetical protein G6F52_006649 [Rhizopus delemar]
MPLPPINDLHQRMGSVAVFTIFDIRTCFHRFLIQGSTRSKTAFAHPFTNLPYTALYIDDLCVFSSGYMSQRVEYVCKALKRLTAEVFHPFSVATGVNAYDIDGVVYQVIDQVIKYNAFAARSLFPTERRYHTNKREFRHFTLITDHKALIYIKEQDVPNAIILVWCETIFEYLFDIAHCPGIKNIIPDALGCLFPDDNKLESYETQTYAVTSATPSSSSSSKPLLHRTLQYEDYITSSLEERKDIILKAHLLGHYGIKAIEQTNHSDKLR